MEYSEQELESERCIDDDYNLINHYYVGKSRHPNLPFYLQDERGQTFEFKWDLIYQYLARLTHD
tara:strand:+ start:432 stop:623 length:192 start_codon:yes stop_codon:yes gene_type:complete